MKKAAWVWRMGLAALLTLAFVLVWPPVYTGSASAEDHVVQTEMHGNHPRMEQDDQVGYLNVKSNADCDASAMACCTMAHCCPGISVGPQDLPVSARDNGATAASAVYCTGSDPGMVLPPPRRLPV
ncbi:hypothetical protein [Haematobacter massiliensis]|uniref:hypothetical protein n=1 Tax=Haematobacter massiliensis TaxID=195105 RepID=UPI00103B738D|nr:hypothetical protein [Haematobacter massiliensis]QBJ22884.1 hypothetical protein HmaOT1_00560 [Haematobacter massiliensis]